MPHCMKFNKDKLEEEYGKLLLHIGGSDIYANTNKEDRANITIECIERLIDVLNKEAGLPKRLSEVGVRKDQFNEIANKAINDGAIIVNPKHASVDNIINILYKAY